MTVGRVESVGLTDSGVDAHMRLDSGTPVPGNVSATVKSVSAIGEQYIDLVPPDEAGPGDTAQRREDRPGTTLHIGQDVAGLLKKAETLVNSVGDSRLRELLHEAFRRSTARGRSWPG